MSSEVNTSKLSRVKLPPRRDHHAPGPDSKRYIDRKRLLQKVPLSYPSIWKRMKAGTFPAPFIDGQKNVWDESEIDSYLAALPKRTYPSTTQG